jgi:hypothetical protein
LYDDTNLQALVNRCARALNRQFDCRSELGGGLRPALLFIIEVG